MARIAVAGFQHETNTFASLKATLADFREADAWPAMVRGTDLPAAVAGMNLPVAGFLAASRHHEIVPLLWCSASPSAPVETEAFETIAGEICSALRKSLPLDALYLDLHGAMVTEAHEDGEGELLSRIRQVTEPDLPIVVSLDLHANVSRRMVDLSDLLVAYRTYPHVDMAETGARAAQGMDRLLWLERPLHRGFAQGGYLVSLVAQSTLATPAREIYERLARLEERPGIVSLSVAMGFPAADVADCGPSIMGYGTDAEAVETAVSGLARMFEEAEPRFRISLLSPDEAVARAMERSRTANRPVILADTQDNPGGGAEGDGVAILEALVRRKAEGAVVGLLNDSDAALKAHQAGVGAEIDMAVGAGSRYGGAVPFEGRFTVERLGDGRFTGTGPFYLNARMDLGPMALLRIGGVRVAVSSRKQQAADREMFRHLGVEPAGQKILALKSSVHFRADFEPIAEEVLIVEAPGPNTADTFALPFARLREGVRRAPRA
ncbi:M81 family metallopeptidase [Inquilinus sp. CAU 1745]|uniref:M81 family metallopeptidase n=1 Tax=Inquilinus sp. CAU 1745 TaxID=3140369 RepID=UPI00325C2360